MNSNELSQFDRLYEKFEKGHRESALAELEEFAQLVNDPWERAELGYHKILWLLDLGRLPEAKLALNDFEKSVGRLVPTPPSDDPTDFSVRLTIEMLSAQIKVAYMDRDNIRALRILNDLMFRYPHSLQASLFDPIFNQMQTYRGLLLANLGRWTEARPFLERPPCPKEWANIVTFYLGQYYYEHGDYRSAKLKLLAALNMTLPPAWEAKAHYLLGIVLHELHDEDGAKTQFEKCVAIGTTEYLSTTKIWEWLEATSLRLGLPDEAEVYKRRRATESRIN
jgi:tetratricopeptide (TPR) repeat protein